MNLKLFFTLTLLVLVYTKDSKQDIYDAKITLKAYSLLEQRGIISSKTLHELKSEILQGFKGNSITELEEGSYGNDLGASSKQSEVSKALGFFTFVNIIWVIAIFICVASFAWLFGIYIVSFLVVLPNFLKELSAWGICFFFIFGAPNFAPHVSPFVAFTGCLGMIFAFILTTHFHFQNAGGRERLFAILLLIILLIVWVPCAIIHNSKLIGFSSAIALFFLLSISGLCKPFCFLFGDNENYYLVKGSGASFFIIVASIIISIYDIKIKYYEPFRTGMLFCGTFFYFSFLLIISNRFYHGYVSDYFFNKEYLIPNLMAILSGVAALFFGSIYPGLEYLQGVGGTFFMLILLTKYAEIGWSGAKAAWGLFGLGGILYGFALFINTFPQYFIFNF